MTVPVTGITPVHGIEYLIEGEPVRNTRAKLERNARQIEAALIAGGVAPAEVSDLIAAGWFTDTGWVDVVPKSGFAAQAGGDRPQVRRRAGVVWLRGGYLSTGMAANGTYTVATLGTSFRPPSSAWPNLRAASSTVAAAGDAFITTGGDVQVRTAATLGSFYTVAGNFLGS